MGANCATCAPEVPSSCGVDTAASCHCTLEAPHVVKTRLRVGCCSGIFDAPIQFAVSRGRPDALDASLSLIQCPPDAGAVMSMLSGGVVDMAVMYTEDAVALAAEGYPLKLCGTFVATGRNWGVYGSSDSVQGSADLQGGTIGMPDEKCAAIILSLLGDLPGWDVVWYCARRHFLSMHRASDAMSKGVIAATIWERRLARRLVSIGDWRLLGQVSMPWPDLVFVASTEALHAKAGTIRHFIAFTHEACEDFAADRDGEPSKFLSGRYGLHAETAKDFLAETSWVCSCQVDPQAVLLPLAHLARVGMVDRNRAIDPMKLLAKGCCMVDQVQALSPGMSGTPCKEAAKQSDDEDFDFLDPSGRSPEVDAASSDPALADRRQEEPHAEPNSASLQEVEDVRSEPDEDVSWEPDEEHSPAPAG